MLAAFPTKGCGGMPSHLLWKVCQASQGKTWRERVLSGEVFADYPIPGESRWFIEFAKARQLEKIQPTDALDHLHAALRLATEREDQLALLASVCDHCLGNGLSIPKEHLDALIQALVEDDLGRESAIDKLYVCCLCLEDLSDHDRLIEMAARLARCALTPPSEDDLRDFLALEATELGSQGPLIELLREGEAPLKTLHIQRGRLWFSGFEFLCNILVICSDLIEEEPWRWAFLQPAFGEWLTEWEKFQRRHGLAVGEDVTLLHRLVEMIEGGSE